jgi:hypothetical protein
MQVHIIEMLKIWKDRLNAVLRCQAQLELTFMMCLSDCSTSTGTLNDRSTSTGALSDRSTSTGALSDRSTFTSTDVRTTDLHHYFFGGLVVVWGHGCLQELKLSPPLSFHGIRAWYRLRAEQQAQEAKEAIQQQEVIISSPFMFATTPVSELFERHRQTTSDRGAVFAKTKL